MNRLTKSSPLTEHEAMNLSLTNLYMRLQAYEDTEIEPEEVERFAKAVKEGRLVVLPRGDDVTPIKCTGLKCPMQAGKVDQATCKAADTCKWATKPLTNADRIRAMTDEELAEYLHSLEWGRFPLTKLKWLDWLTMPEPPKEAKEDG